jgi:hypothetical protein
MSRAENDRRPAETRSDLTLLGLVPAHQLTIKRRLDWSLDRVHYESSSSRTGNATQPEGVEGSCEWCRWDPGTRCGLGKGGWARARCPLPTDGVRVCGVVVMVVVWELMVLVLTS